MLIVLREEDDADEATPSWRVSTAAEGKKRFQVIEVLPSFV